MRITATEEVGMRCMLRLAARPSETLSITELAADEGVTEPFAAKVLLALRRGGLVLATRGRHGGYRLADQPETISVARVLHALGKPLFDSRYCRDHKGVAASCVRMPDCSLRPVWAQLERIIDSFFESTTLADLVIGEGRTAHELEQRWALTAPAEWHSMTRNQRSGGRTDAVNR